MAICKDCNREMASVLTWSCDLPLVVIDGIRLYGRIRYGKERADFARHSRRCHDCNVARNGYHHKGCDVEECPFCHGQYFLCRGRHGN